MSGVEIREFEAPFEPYASACLGRSRDRVLFGGIRKEKRAFVFEVYDVGEKSEMLCRIDATERKNVILSNFLIILGFSWVFFLCVLFLALPIFFWKDMMMLIERFVLGKDPIMFFFFLSVLMIPPIVSMYSGRIIRLYAFPSVVLERDKVVVFYRNGLVRYYNLGGDFVSEMRIANLSRKKADVSGLLVIIPIIVFVLIWFTAYLIIFFSTLSHGTSFFEWIMMLLILYFFLFIYTFFFFPIVLPFLMTQKGIIIHKCYDYICAICTEILGSVSIFVIKESAIIESYKIRTKKKFMKISPRIKGAIINRSLTMIVYWTLQEIYALDVSTGRDKKIFSLRNFLDFIVSVHWIKQDADLFIVTTRGEIFLSDLEGKITLLRDYGKRVLYATRIDNEVYLAVSSHNITDIKVYH